jgi:hypothetical protein
MGAICDICRQWSDGPQRCTREDFAVCHMCGNTVCAANDTEFLWAAGQTLSDDPIVVCCMTCEAEAEELGYLVEDELEELEE